jgi:predicted acetyltransferase
VLVVVRSEVETTLRVRNVFASDAVAAAALFDVIGSWVGQITTVSLRVGQPSLLSLLLAWDHHIRLDSFPYMLRVVDLPEAIASRGWPTARQLRPTTVDVEVVDKRAPWNEGCWRVTIDDGVHVARGNRADVRLSARGLSAWYAGAASLASLKRVGLADGDSASIEKASVLDTLTAVPGPVWISDDF